ncbi:MAG: DUF790 family protein [Gemmataceae bacterium]
MLTGNLLRVRTVRNRIVPYYLSPDEPEWLAAAERMLLVYRDATGRTRGEIESDIEELTPEGPHQLIFRGLAKLLDDRCEYDAEGEFPPETIRESAFRLASEFRKAAEKSGVAFDRDIILQDVAQELSLTRDQVDVGLFADLKAEQRVVRFESCSADFLIKRYNVALAQAVLIRSTGLDVRLWDETPNRFRALFRAAKFHKLICSIRSGPDDSYLLQLDGPLSLFSSTQKYGLQLAMWLPTLMHCQQYELQARLTWGAQRKERLFLLSSKDGLPSHTPDFGQFRPKELDIFAQNFTKLAEDWTIAADPVPVPLGEEVWVPDFRLTHRRGTVIDLEVVGYWRRVSVERQIAKLTEHRPRQFLLLVGDQYKADEDAVPFTHTCLVRYKRTPSAADVLKAANALRGE